MKSVSGHRKERRGATIVFVALMSVVLVAMGAFAVDVSRMYVGTNELQTGADAAALRGALRLQRVPATDPSNAVIAFATNNPAMNAPIAVSADDIKPIFWDPTTGAAVATWSTANAVEVTTRQTAGLLFGRILTNVAPVPQRRAIAWVANLVGATCIKPWALPMGEVLEMVGGTASPVRALTQDEINQLRTMTPQQRTIVVAPPYSGVGQVPAPAPNGSWAAIRVGGSGLAQYKDAISGESTTCPEDQVLLEQERDKPGNNLENATTQVIDDAPANLCTFVGSEDTCYSTSGAVGTAVTVAYGTSSASFGTDPITIKMIGEFVIVCYRRGGAGGSPNEAVGGTGNTCAWPGFEDMTAYDEGTMIGYVNPDIASPGPGTVYGNTTSIAQKLILVR